MVAQGQQSFEWLETAPSSDNGGRTRVDPAGDEKASVVWRVSYLPTLEAWQSFE